MIFYNSHLWSPQFLAKQQNLEQHQCNIRWCNLGEHHEL